MNLRSLFVRLTIVATLIAALTAAASAKTLFPTESIFVEPAQPMFFVQSMPYTENFGTTATLPTGWTSTSTTNGWGPSLSSASTTYTGASGGNNIVMNNAGTAGVAQRLTYDNGLSTVGLTNITVLWGGRGTAAFTQGVTFEWSADGTTWNPVSYTQVANDATWRLVNNGTRIALGAGAAGITNLRLRWSSNVVTSGGNYRIDDLTVQGTTAVASTTTTITSTSSTITYGNTVTLTATTTSSSVPVTVGTLKIYDGGVCSGTPLASGTPDVNGKVSFTSTTLSGGAHSIVGCYTAGTGFSDSTSSVFTQTVNPASQTINVAAIPNSDFILGPQTWTAATGGASGNPVTMTNATPGVCTLASDGSSTASFVTVGDCTIKFNQAGNTNYSAAPEVTRTFNIFASPTTMTATTANASVPYATSNLITATANYNATGSKHPSTGTTIKFIEGGTCASPTTVRQAGQTPNSSGVVTFNTAGLPVGSHDITACFSGNNVTVASQSAPVTQTITAATCHVLTPGTVSTTPAASITVPVSMDAVAPTEVINSADFNIVYDPTVLRAVHTSGDTVSFTKGLADADAIVNVSEVVGSEGTIKVSVADSTGLNTSTGNTLVNISFTVIGAGGSSSTLTIPAGATFGNPDAGFLCVTRESGLVTVVGATTTTQVTSTGDSTYGDSVTFTATMTANPANPPVSGGSVAFYDGATDCAAPGMSPLGTVNLTGGNSVQFSTAALTAVTHSILGCYSGTPNFTASSGTVTQNVAKKPVAAAVAANNKIYNALTDATIASCAIPAKVGLDDVGCTVGSASFADKNVGDPKTVTATGILLTGNTAGNYALSSNTATASAKITPRGLTVSATADNKPYDGTTTAAAHLSSDMISGDVLILSNTGAAFDTKNVGTNKDVNVSGISVGGTDAGNYNLLNTSAVAKANITARTLIVSAAGVNKIYDGGTAATVTLSDDRISGDVFTSAYTTASFADKTVANNKPVSVSGISISGTDAGNYTANTTAATTANITARDLHVTAAGVNKVYDGLTTATVNLSSDKIAADALTLSYGSATFASKAVGSGIGISVTGISVGGSDAGNYNLANQTAATVANITEKHITGTFTSQNKVYDRTTNAVVVTRGLAGAVTDDVVSLTGGTATFSDRAVATGKTVTLTGAVLSGTDSTNYILDSVATTTADITPLGITGSFTADSRVYNGLTTATVATRSLSGVIDPDVVTLSGGTASFNTKAVGTGKVVTLTGATLAGADAGNYSLASVATATADITELHITGTFTANDKTYDGNTNAVVGNRSLNGAVAADAVALTGGTASFADANAGSNKVVTLTGATLGGADATNYILDSVATALASIGKADAACSVTPYNVPYDGNSHTAAGSCYGVGGPSDVLGGLDVTHTVHTDPGTYPSDYWFFTAPNANYKDKGNTTIEDSITTGTLTGTVSYAYGSTPAKAIDGVTVTATGTPTLTGTTAANGGYSIAGFGAGTYTFAASKAKQGCSVVNGITSDDAALVSQYVVGLTSFNAMQQAAGHVSSVTSTISSLDAALIAQKAVANCHVNNRSGEWAFDAGTLASTIMGTDRTDNFTGYMMGDVDGSWSTGGQNRQVEDDATPSPNAVLGSLPNVSGNTASQIVVPFRIDNLNGKSVRSTQFTISYDPNVIEAVPTAASVQGTNAESLGVVSNVPEPGKLMVAVYGAVPVSGDGVYVNLSFTIKGAGGTSSPLAITGFRFNADTDEVGVVNGRVAVANSSSSATLNGRLVSADGRGVGRAVVQAISAAGVASSVSTGKGGRFSFPGLVMGETYTVTVRSRRYDFGTHTVTLTDNVTELQLIAAP